MIIKKHIFLKSYYNNYVVDIQKMGLLIGKPIFLGG